MTSRAVDLRDSQLSAARVLLDYQQLAAWLNDSVRHLRRLVSEERIPYIKIGHFVRFDPAEIAEWLNANRRGSV
jgi:excisionase family DNA binding protein